MKKYHWIKHSTNALFCSMIGLSVAETVFAHGFIQSPASRAHLCQLNQNENCGSVRYEPQSLEAEKGFPNNVGYLPDGKIASANRPSDENMNDQSPVRWIKVPMVAGEQKFKWKLTAPHRAERFEYYMTKPDWNPSAKLTRASFEATPFCKIEYNLGVPPKDESHSCTVPQRQGYQVMLAVWVIGDTSKAFYNVVDVDFGGTSGGNAGGGNNSNPDVVDNKYSEIGELGRVARPDLEVGTAVSVRFFTQKGEWNDSSKPNASILIGAQDVAYRVWSKKLADAINSQTDVIKAGHHLADGTFATTYGRNTVYALNASNPVTSIELDFQKPQQVDLSHQFLLNLTNNEGADFVKESGQYYLQVGLSPTHKAYVYVSVRDEKSNLLATDAKLIHAQSSDVFKLPVNGLEQGKTYIIHMSAEQDRDQGGFAELIQRLPLNWTVPNEEGDKGDAYPEWSSTQTYVYQDRVRLGGAVWEAKWWVRGTDPRTVGQWGPWKRVSQ